MPDDKAASLCSRYEKMDAAYAPTREICAQIREVVLPMAGPQTGMESPGTRSHGQVFDSTGEQANEVLASGIFGILTNPATKWLKLGTGDDDLNRRHDVSAWCEHATQAMLDAFNSGRGAFNTAQPAALLELCSFGTSTKYQWEDPYRRLIWKHCPLATLRIAENAYGRIDTWFRKFELSAGAAVRFPLFRGNLSPKLIDMASKEPDRPFQFLHAVYPRQERREGSAAAADMPWASVYAEVETKHTVVDGGMPQPGYTTARWSVRREAGSAEIYGRGPGHKALSDVMMLQAVMKDTLRALQKSVNPPLLVADDGVMGPTRTYPDGMTYIRSESWARDPVKPLMTGARPDIGEEFMASMRERVHEAFYRSHLLAVRRLMDAYTRPPTATQVMELKEEELQVLGPIFGRIQVEDLESTIEQCFWSLYGAGWIKPMPEALRRLPTFKLEFINPVQQAQRMAEVKGITRTLELISPLVQLDPSIVDNWSNDKTYNRIAEIMGWPADTRNSPDLVKQMRQARAEEAARQQQLAEAQALAAAAGDAAKVIPALRSAA